MSAGINSRCETAVPSLALPQLRVFGAATSSHTTWHGSSRCSLLRPSTSLLSQRRHTAGWFRQKDADSSCCCQFGRHCCQPPTAARRRFPFTAASADKEDEQRRGETKKQKGDARTPSHALSGLTMTSPSSRICSAQLAMMIPTSSDISRQPSTTAAITPFSQSGRQPSCGSRYTCHTALAERRGQGTGQSRASKRQGRRCEQGRQKGRAKPLIAREEDTRLVWQCRSSCEEAGCETARAEAACQAKLLLCLDRHRRCGRGGGHMQLTTPQNPARCRRSVRRHPTANSQAPQITTHLC